MLKRIVTICAAVLVVIVSQTCLAQDRMYKVEVVQVTALNELQKIYDGFVKELEKNGLVQGKNLTVKRTVIDYDLENTTWSKKLTAYMKIKSEASRIAREKPDLVLTMGTPATKFSKDKITSAGIPLLFTALAYPSKVGCKSETVAGPGFTGVTTYSDMKEALTIVRSSFPEIKTMGIVHSEYSGSSNSVEDAVKEGPGLGFTFITKQVNMKDSIMPALRELQKKGVQAIAVPADPYYEVRGYEAARELNEFSKAAKLPVVSFVIDGSRGPLLEVGVDFEKLGSLSGGQAARILKEGIKPGTLPILRQQELTVIIGPKKKEAFGNRPSPASLQAVRPAG